MGLDVILREQTKLGDAVSPSEDITIISYRGWASLAHFIRTDVLKQSGRDIDEVISELDLLKIIIFIKDNVEEWEDRLYIRDSKWSVEFTKGYNFSNKERMLDRLEDLRYKLKSGKEIMVHISS